MAGAWLGIERRLQPFLYKTLAYPFYRHTANM